MPASGGRSAPNRSNSALHRRLVGGVGGDGHERRAGRRRAARSTRPAGSRGTRTRRRWSVAPMSASCSIRCGPMLPVAPMTRWLRARRSSTASADGSVRAACIQPGTCRGARPVDDLVFAVAALRLGQHVAGGQTGGHRLVDVDDAHPRSRGAPAPACGRSPTARRAPGWPGRPRRPAARCGSAGTARGGVRRAARRHRGVVRRAGCRTAVARHFVGRRAPARRIQHVGGLGERTGQRIRPRPSGAAPRRRRHRPRRRARRPISAPSAASPITSHACGLRSPGRRQRSRLTGHASSQYQSAGTGPSHPRAPRRSARRVARRRGGGASTQCRVWCHGRGGQHRMRFGRVRRLRRLGGVRGC